MKIKKNKKQFLNVKAASMEKAGFVIVPLPYEMTTSYGKGTKRGPAAVISASSQLELWDEELEKETWKEGFFTMSPPAITYSERIFFSRIGGLVDSILGKIVGVPFFIGGEHSITQGILPSFQKKYKDLSILHFDAHADLRPTYEGSSHSHACALYLASRTVKTVQVGIRSVSSDEKKFVNSGKVKTFFMHENLDMNVLAKNVLKELTGTVYISIDADGFDPAVMPGTGTPQPGGFSWYDALLILKTVCMEKEVVGADIVEVSPCKNSSITEMTAAKLIYRLAGYVAERKGKLPRQLKD